MAILTPGIQPIHESLSMSHCESKSEIISKPWLKIECSIQNWYRCLKPFKPQINESEYVLNYA